MLTSIRFILSIDVSFDLEVEYMDVKTTFLHRDLEEEIYMKQPEGFVVKGKKEMVCKLIDAERATWHVRSHRIFFFSARRTLRFFYFPIGKSAPTVLSCGPLPGCIGGSELVTSRVQRLNTGFSDPRDPMVSQLADFSLREFATRDLATRETKLLVLQSPIPEVPKLRCARVT
jgi:hypothetical protein